MIDCRSTFSLVLLLTTPSASAAPQAAPATPDTEFYLQQLEAWHRARIERLTADDGWLTLIGLFWLEEGLNPVGSGASCTVCLPANKAPARVGNIQRLGPRLEFHAQPEATVLHAGEAVSTIELRSDIEGEPTVLAIGDLRFFAIQRQDRYAVRVRDRAHPARFGFKGIERYPATLAWRVTGRFEPYDPPKPVSVPNVLGGTEEQPSPGAVVFALGDEHFRLDALEGPDGRLFLIFSDKTSGDETYGGGRFLYSEPPTQDGEVVVDFNRAYNPPCAFTDFATCPLPPRQNRLAARREAGERIYERRH